MTPPAKYRQKPVVIDAMRWGGPSNENVGTLYRFTDETLVKDGPHGSYGSIDHVDGSIIMHTIDGDLLVNVGDWIIRDVYGRFTRSAPAEFDATYELVVDDG